MSNICVDILIRIAAGFGTLAAILISVLKNHSNEKIRESATRIAEVVETIYRGSTSSEKLNAFKQLCKEQKINVKKAVKFLEKYIIPSSKQINVIPTRNDAENNTNSEGWA